MFTLVLTDQGRCTSGRKVRGFSGAAPINGVAVGAADAVGEPTVVEDGIAVGVAVGDVPTVVAVAAAVGDVPTVVGVAVRVGFGDGSTPLKGVSVT